MLSYFLKYGHEQGLFQKGDRILLAVSGGADSVVMAHLFWEAGFEIGIAHCNFQLRGADSEADVAFVQQLAEELEAPFYTIRFDTLEASGEGGISVQMAARQLRYTWLEEQRIAGDYDAIATAHHLDDAVETLLYNFTKGCGLHGLQGIPVRQGKIIRPLLFAHKATILQFASENEIAYREDQSNSEDKYARNHLRHHVIPALQALNPAFLSTAAANIQRLHEAEHLMDMAVTRLKAELTHTDAQGNLRIDYQQLRCQNAAPTLLYEWLGNYGFSAASLARLLHDGSHTGAILYAPAHRLLLNRDVLILEPLPDHLDATEVVEIPNPMSLIELSDGYLEMEQVAPPTSFGTDKYIAYLHLKSSDYPLRLRHWQSGDAFQPLGMGGRRQKLQDLFSNAKLSRFEKDRIWLLETADSHICWVVGLRADERFRVSEQYPSCTRLTWRVKPSS